MPLYEYKCLKCGRLSERIERVAGPHLKKCPHCGGKVESVLSAPAIQFKGTGWYVTDYAGKSGSKEAAAGESKDSAKNSATKDGAAKESAPKESSSKDSSAKDTKPAKKK